jgi:hypothetical protein
LPASGVLCRSSVFVVAVADAGSFERSSAPVLILSGVAFIVATEQHGRRNRSPRITLLWSDRCRDAHRLTPLSPEMRDHVLREGGAIAVSEPPLVIGDEGLLIGKQRVRKVRRVCWRFVAGRRRRRIWERRDVDQPHNIVFADGRVADDPAPVRPTDDHDRALRVGDRCSRLGDVVGAGRIRQTV